MWAAAIRAGDIEATLGDLGPERVADEYKDAKRAGADPELVEVLHQRFTSVQRLLDTVDDTAERLRLLVSRSRRCRRGGGYRPFLDASWTSPERWRRAEPGASAAHRVPAAARCDGPSGRRHRWSQGPRGAG